MVTAGDVVFYGTMDGWFRALDAHRGKKLWEFRAGSGIIGQPTTYLGPDGKQYVAVLSGVGWWAGAVVSGDLDIRDPTGIEIVDADDALSLLNQPITEMRPNKACAARHYDGDRFRCALSGRLQRSQGFVDAATANQVDDEPCLLRRTLNVFCDCSRFHCLFTSRLTWLPAPASPSCQTFPDAL